ncbi:MAG: hypothetical protein EPO13_02435 [Actinomycetota bacterium]|nr:MAG: hypothetical protein EPO13_02435 [Actinomycetota bacterium]
MAGDDDIERLLREVEAANSGSPAAVGREPARSRPKDAAQQADSPGGVGRFRFAVMAALVMAVPTGLLGLFLPFVGSFQLAIGGAIGAFATAAVAGPPRWLR